MQVDENLRNEMRTKTAALQNENLIMELSLLQKWPQKCLKRRQYGADQGYFAVAVT